MLLRFGSVFEVDKVAIKKNMGDQKPRIRTVSYSPQGPKEAENLLINYRSGRVVGDQFKRQLNSSDPEYQSLGFKFLKLTGKPKRIVLVTGADLKKSPTQIKNIPVKGKVKVHVDFTDNLLSFPDRIEFTHLVSESVSRL